VSDPAKTALNPLSILIIQGVFYLLTQTIKRPIPYTSSQIVGFRPRNAIKASDTEKWTHAK